MQDLSPDKPHLSSEYYKARNKYNLFSGLLFAWELIGIEIKETPIEKINITLKSPDAAPYALIVILCFYAFRFSIEWHQSDKTRRDLIQSKIDYFSSHFISIAAISLFLIQSALNNQVFHYASKQANNIILVILVMFLSTILSFAFRSRSWEKFIIKPNKDNRYLLIASHINKALSIGLIAINIIIAIIAIQAIILNPQLPTHHLHFTPKDGYTAAGFDTSGYVRFMFQLTLDNIISCKANTYTLIYISISSIIVSIGLLLRTYSRHIQLLLINNMRLHRDNRVVVNNHLSQESEL
jgi:hypothetical protein